MLAASSPYTINRASNGSSRTKRRSSGIPPDVIQELITFATPASHPTGTQLFAEGQHSRGVFILCSGRIKLYTSSTEGKVLILRVVADPGEMIGVASVLCGQPYEASAEAALQTETGFVKREHFLGVMGQHRELALHVAMKLGESYRSAIAGVRAVGFPRSASQRLATFLLNWCETNRSFDCVARFSITHEEIAQSIGSSRETVSRILSNFRKKGLIHFKDRELFLLDGAALETWAAEKKPFPAIRKAAYR